MYFFALVISTICFSVENSAQAALFTPINHFQSLSKSLFSPNDEIEIQGEIIRYPGKNTVFVRLPGKTAILPIRSGYRETQMDLEHLETGDYVIGRGEVVSQGYVLLEALELLGIKKILGKWNERHAKLVFHFQNFSSLRIEKTVDGTKYFENLKYRLAPDSKDSWTLFLAESAGVHLGQMDYVQSKLRIRFINVNTGEVLQTLMLDALNFLP